MPRGTHWLRWIPIAVVFNNNFYTLQTVTGRSMQPTLNPDYSSWRDVALFDRTSRVSEEHKYQRGDIVALRSPIAPKTLLVKRIIALEGDRVQTLPPYPEREVVVPEGHAWIEGDERFHSEDSNHFGPVSLALMDAKLVYIVWPPNRFGRLHNLSTGAPMFSPTWREKKNDDMRQLWRTARVRRRGEGDAWH